MNKWQDLTEEQIRALCAQSVSIVDFGRKLGHQSDATAYKNAKKVITFSTKNPQADIYGYNIHKNNNPLIFQHEKHCKSGKNTPEPKVRGGMS